ncbi:hypothetical protein HPT27_10425 [Permianibacter sp. IMCC34836]|uniref:hypothetical protein n=1 Tax=Permianibacter fluminis TaxID=2738515 RepID=UPI0015516B56|nr:hypothetical protein [Permianibacter fluminis]NQD37444.1 hypothetical protein [Permianibacter fluminis]
MSANAEQKVVMIDDPESATYRTDIKGWVSRDGRFFGDGPLNERTARWSGCTHTPCSQCGNPTEKHYTKCEGCRALAEEERYNAMPRAEWDGQAMLYSVARDCYFHDLDQAEDELEEGEKLTDLMLVICIPNHVRELEPDYCCDECDEDGDLPDEVITAMEAFNKAVAGIVLSWSPGKFALGDKP